MKNFSNDDIDITVLQKLYKTTPLFRTFMDYLASQKEDERQLTVRILEDNMNKANIRVGRADVLRMLQTLNGKKCGWFTVGRKGWPSRFYFDVSMTALAKEVSGKNKPIVPMKAPVNMINHKFRLRPEIEVSFELPEDLTDKEVGRIADFLKTLPFDDAGSSMAA